jgi:hypothetical protein
MLVHVSDAAGEEQHRAAAAPLASQHSTVAATAAAEPVTPGSKSHAQTDATAPSATALCTFVSAASSDALPAHSPSEADATTTPLSTKLHRRTQIFSNEGREIDDQECDDDVDEQNEVSPRPQHAAVRSAADVAADVGRGQPSALTGARPLQDDDGVRLEFRSVLQQLEKAGCESQSQLQDHLSSVDLPSSLAPPSVILQTPRDGVPAANLRTPFVFSTVHLKSPAQVRSGMILAPSLGVLR